MRRNCCWISLSATLPLLLGFVFWLNCVKLFLTMSQIVFQQNTQKHFLKKKYKMKFEKRLTKIMIILSYVRKEAKHIICEDIAHLAESKHRKC